MIMESKNFHGTALIEFDSLEEFLKLLEGKVD